MIYIASPYSGTELEQVYRFEEVRKHVYFLIKQGFPAFSPIVYAHELAYKFKMKTDADTWERFNTTIIRRCDCIQVYMLEGWEKSKGVTAEIALAKQLYIPVYYMSPENYASH